MGLAAQRLAPTAAASPALRVSTEAVVMNAHKEGPPDAMELDPVWVGLQTIFWGGLLLKLGNIL